MKFLESHISGVFLIEPPCFEDERGYFSMTWQPEVFAKQGLETRLLQCNTSFNHQKGTLRGLHYQVAPYQEVKLVRCVRGSVFDVVVDLRENSPTRYQWVGYRLTADRPSMVYVPQGCAHGYQTLEDRSDVVYQVSQVYDSPSARGVMWDDPKLGIEWPEKVTVISERDQAHPYL